MSDIFNVVDNMKNTFISYRFWAKNKNANKMLEIINKHYKTNIKKVENNKINENIFISTFKEFIWPDINNNYYSEKGKCYALKDHIGILSNGDVVPCCLDANATINLGNIFDTDLEIILNSDRVNNIIKGFRNNKKCEELCKHCNFLEKE